MLREIRNVWGVTVFWILTNLLHFIATISYAVSIFKLLQTLNHQDYTYSLIRMGLLITASGSGFFFFYLKGSANFVFLEALKRSITNKIVNFWAHNSLHEFLKIDHTTKLAFLTRQVNEVAFGINSALNGMLLLIRLAMYFSTLSVLLPISISYVGPFLFILLSSPFFFRKIYKLIGELYLDKNQSHAILHQNVLDYINFFKNRGDEEKLFAFYTKKRTENLNKAVRLTKYAAVIGLVTNFGSGVAHASSIAITLMLTYVGRAPMEIIPTFVIMSFNLFTSTTETLQVSFISYVSIKKTYKETIEKTLTTENPTLSSPSMQESIILEKIKIKVPDKTLLNNLSLKLKKGEKLLVVGPSGVGKSSLLALIMGLADYEGKILIDNQPVDTPKNYLSLFKLSFLTTSKTEFFTGSLLDNLTMGDKNLEKDAHKLLRELNITRFDPTQIIDDRQIPFSVGEQQILGLIRALLSDKPLLLFDEATANVDAKTALKIIKKIVEQKDKTIIFVSHTLKEENSNLFDQVLRL